MPNIKSAKKRVLVSARRNEENVLVKSSMKTAIKNVEKAAKANDKAATDNLKVANTRIDKAVNTGIVKKNKAARLKSRLAKMTNNME